MQLICWRTTPRTVSRPKPSDSDMRKASSRFGPWTPLLPARLSTWHEPHDLTKAFLPAIRSAFAGTASVPHALSAAASDAPAARLMSVLVMGVLLMGARDSIRGDRRSASSLRAAAPGR